MIINTFSAGDLTTETVLPSTEDVVKLGKQAVQAVAVLSDDLKTADNLNRIFFLTVSDGWRPKNCFYKLVIDTYDEETETYTYKFINVEDDVSVGTLPELIKCLEDYPKFKNSLPQPGDAILVDYIFDDQTYGTKTAVEEHIDELGTIQVPFTILGYNKTIPQYVKYRCRIGGSYDYKYVSSIDDKSIDVTIDGVPQNVFIKHGWENANKIDENDCTGLLRPITSGCKTYSRSAGGFAQTSQFTETGDVIEAVSEEIARNILAKDNGTHTYGNNNPYDCPMTITVNGNIYAFCGYTVTVQSTNLLTGKFNGTYLEIVQFDIAEDKYAPAVDRYKADGSYYKRSGLTFTAMTPAVGDVIAEEDVYEYDAASKTMLCRSAYVQDFHEYGTELSGVSAEGTEHLAGTVPIAGTLITDASLSVENNNYWDGKKYTNAYGCNKWCQSNIRTFMNFGGGRAEYAGAFIKKNPFDNSSPDRITSGNSLQLKFAKDPDFLKYVCPAVNRNAVPDKQYNTSSDAYKNYRGSFVAYKQENKSSLACQKIYVSHDTDKFFLLNYTEAGFTGESVNFDRFDSTSDFTDVYPTGNNEASNKARQKQKYLASGGLDASSVAWWLRTPDCHYSYYTNFIQSAGRCNSYYSNTASYRFAPACTLY